MGQHAERTMFNGRGGIRGVNPWSGYFSWMVPQFRAWNHQLCFDPWSQFCWNLVQVCRRHFSPLYFFWGICDIAREVAPRLRPEASNDGHSMVLRSPTRWNTPVYGTGICIGDSVLTRTWMQSETGVRLASSDYCQGACYYHLGLVLFLQQGASFILVSHWRASRYLLTLKGAKLGCDSVPTHIQFLKSKGDPGTDDWFLHPPVALIVHRQEKRPIWCGE